MSKIFKTAFIGENPFVLSSRSEVTKDAEKMVSALEVEAERRSQKKAEELLTQARAEAGQIKADAEAEAERYMAAVRAEALEVKQEAHDEGHETGRKQGFQEGYSSGLSQAEEEMREKVLDTAKKAEQLINYAEQAAHNTIVNAEGQILEMVLQIAKKVISHKLASDDNVIVDIVGAAMEKVKGQEQVIVKLNQADYATILLQKDVLQGCIGQETKLSFAVETNLHKGDCIVETANGVLDATMETKFSIIEKTVREMM